MQANLIGHSMYRNCLLKHGTEGKSKGRMEVKGRRKRRRKKLLDGLKKSRMMEIERGCRPYALHTRRSSI